MDLKEQELRRILAGTLPKGEVHSPTKSRHELDDEIRAAGGLRTPVSFTQTRLADKYQKSEPTKKLVTFKGVVFQLDGRHARVIYGQQLAMVRITTVGKISVFVVEEGHHYPDAVWHLNTVSVAVRRRRHCFSLLSGGLRNIHLKAPDGSAYARESRACPGTFLPFSRTHGHPYRQFVCCQCNAGFRTFSDLALHSGIAPRNLAHW